MEWWRTFKFNWKSAYSHRWSSNSMGRKPGERKQSGGYEALSNKDFAQWKEE